LRFLCSWHYIYQYFDFWGVIFTEKCKFLHFLPIQIVFPGLLGRKDISKDNKSTMIKKKPLVLWHWNSINRRKKYKNIENKLNQTSNLCIYWHTLNMTGFNESSIPLKRTKDTPKKVLRDLNTIIDVIVHW
jgi:hypothetical protein